MNFFRFETFTQGKGRHGFARRMLLAFGLMTAALIGIGAPAGFLALSLNYHAELLDHEAEELALDVASRARLDPKIWREDESRLTGPLRKFRSDDDQRRARVVDADGRVLAVAGDAPEGFTVSRRAIAQIGPDEAAVVEITAGVNDLYAEALICAVFSLGVAGGILYLLWVGLRAIRTREVDDDRHRENLERLVAERTGTLVARTESLLAEVERREAMENGLRAAKADADHLRLRLTEAIESITEGFVLYGRDRRLLLCNEKFRTIHAPIADILKPGVTLKEVLSAIVANNLIDFGDADPEQWIQWRLERPEGMADMRYANGMWLRRSTRRTHDGGHVFVFTDITNLKESQVALTDAWDQAEDARVQLEEAIESVTEGFALFDSDQRLVICNSKYQAISGMRAKPGTARRDLLRAIARAGLVDLGGMDPARWVDHRLENPVGSGDIRYADGTWLRCNSHRTADGGFVLLFMDITNLKDSETALAAARDDAENARRRLIDAIEAIDEGFVLYDADDRLVICNTKFKIMNPGVGDILRPSVARKEIVERLVRGGHIDTGGVDPERWITQRITYTDRSRDVRYADGTWQRGISRRTQDGGLVVAFMDITNLKESEAALAEARDNAEDARLQLVEAIESITEGFALFDGDQRLVICNEKFRSIHAAVAGIMRPGVSRQEILDAVARSDLIDKRDLPPDRWVEQRFAHVGEFRDLRYANGTWLRCSTRQTHNGGTVVVFTDITNLKEGEAALITARDDAENARLRLTEAIEAIDEGFVLYDRDGRLVICNSKFRVMHQGAAGILQPGITRRQIVERLVSDGLIDIGDSDPAGWVEERLTSSDYTRDVRFLNGTWQRCIFRRTLDGGTVVVFMDITNLKDSEAALQGAKEEAEAANRSKSQFLANMSHEIRTPMSGIIGMAELMARSGLNDRQKKYVRTIRESGMTLLTIINDILDFSRIEAGRLELGRGEFDLRDTTEDVAALLAPIAAKKNIDLTCRVEESVPEIVWGDRTRLQQVLTNLVSNAIKFTERGAVHVDVAASATGERIVPVRFAIRDTGIGVDAEAKARLFKPFEQADGSITRRFGGTGLGLSISQEIVSLMGGRIEVDSVPGRGSTFTFTIPFDRGRTSGAGRLRPGIGPWPKRALVIDGNEASRSVLVSAFKSWEAEVETVTDSAAAIDRLDGAWQTGQPFDLVVLDAATPGDGGVAFAAALAANPAADAMRLIVVEAVDRPSPAAVTNGQFVGVVTKPVRHSDLYDAVMDLFERRSDGARRSEQKERRQPDVAPFTSASVLLVEDNSVNQEVNTELLASLGCTVELATTGWEAIAAFERGRYDLILMDCQMPELDGLEATKRIREQEALAGADSRTPIVALTAHAFEEHRQRCFAAGMDDYLTKPLTMDMLIAALKRWVRLEAPAIPGASPLAVGSAGADASSHPLIALRDQAGPEVVVSVVNTYLSDTPKQLALLREALDRSDAVVVQRTAHSLKSSSAIVGGSALSDVCREIERIGHDGDLNAAGTLIAKAEQAFTALQAALRAEFLGSDGAS